MNYDDTKRMLNTLRKLNESKLVTKIIKEENELPTDQPQNTNVRDDIDVINNVDIKILSSDEADMKMDDEDKKSISSTIDNFKSQVSNLVEFDPGFTISQEQIRLDGTLTDYDIDFVLIAGEEHGLYINADMLKLEKEVVDVLSKLQIFFNTFLTPMNDLINKRKNN